MEHPVEVVRTVKILLKIFFFVGAYPESVSTSKEHLFSADVG